MLPTIRLFSHQDVELPTCTAAAFVVPVVSFMGGRLSSYSATSVPSFIPTSSISGRNSRNSIQSGTSWQRPSTMEPTTSIQGDTVQNPNIKTLDLLTFDLDDTLYPLEIVIEEANTAFAAAMKKYGFPNIESEQINAVSIQLRKELAKTDAEQAATVTHTELRKLAIRRAMEDVMLERKLLECAKDWATNVESLGPAVVKSAQT